MHMKKLLLFMFAVLSFVSVYAQHDTEHWFAPMSDKTGSSGSQILYLSTNSTTPFPVTIYNNNTVIGTVTVVKGTPATFPISTRSMIITTSAADLFTPKPMGLYLKADLPFYATLRFQIPSHAEIVTSKGKAGIGKNFFVAYAPITTPSSIYNFTTGIMATEDNTTVTVSNYDPAVTFTNGNTGATNPTLTFTLNKGKSYIIEGVGNIAGNFTGFIGAKITSNKPVSVTNGNMNGQFATTGSFGGSDIIMDQSVPVERLGNEFMMIKGNGDIGRGMEGALIVATEDNTDIFINNGTTSVATLNAGQFYRINDNVWVNQGNNHYNMYIKTTKNAYVYQLLAGVADSNATLGFNYIPPLNCYLPRKIDEIGKINEMPGITPTVKLNILTEAGATVTVNGAVPPASQGPYPALGTTNWVSYSIPNVTGEVTVVSSKAVTAGIIGGSGVYGYGGYFAGFSSVPVIAKKTGSCIPGIILEVADTYETYQWYLNGTAIPGANSPTFTPTVAGNYTCLVGISGCQSVLTPVFQVFTCPKLTTVNTTVCASKTFTPAFSTSTQTIDFSTVTITQQPAHGTVTIAPGTGVITYVPTAGYSGPDTFTYSFSGTTPVFVDSEVVTVNIDVILLTTKEATLTSCPYNGLAKFDLSSAAVTDYPGTVTKKYYPTLANAQNGTNEITNSAAYMSAAGSVYVKVMTAEGCIAYGKITLKHFVPPVVTDTTISTCFLQDNVLQGVFNLQTATVTAVPGATIKYFTSVTNAENGTNEILTPLTYMSPNAMVYAKVTDVNGCYSIAKIILKVIPPKYSAVLKDKIICVEDKTTLDAGPGYTSYEWSTGAITQSISNVGVGEYWVLLKSDGCYTKQVVKVIKSASPVVTNIEVSNNTVTLTVEGGTKPYKFSRDGVTWQDSNSFSLLPRGENTFYVKDALDCDPIVVSVTVPNIPNSITPNNDGINDVIDLSALAYKKDLALTIYDRYGNKIFTADKSNAYKWDGRFSDKKIHTGTYWYDVTWTEQNKGNIQVKYNNWILVKNRD